MPNPVAPIPIENEAEVARQTQALLDKHRISPSPENYAVWFHYAAGKNKELVREIDTVLSNSLPFTPETCAYLYNKYIVPARNQKAVDDSAASAHKVLIEVLRVVNDFSGETQTYTKSIDHYMDHISQEFQDEGVKKIFKELVEATSTMKKSGEKITKKLEESTQEINTLKKDLQQVTNEAQRDFLTGVFNRKTFERFIDEQMVAAKEHKKSLCLLMIDIDYFKKFNDRHGHLLGDEVLKTVARTLTELLKGRDSVARFGGEEFVVVLPETPIEGAMKVADMIRTAIAGKELKRKDTGEHFGTITISVGVAHFRPDSDTLPTFIKRADDALYQSKRHGRNRVTKEAS